MVGSIQCEFRVFGIHHICFLSEKGGSDTGNRIMNIRLVAGQGSSPETRFSFLKHFRILYPFIPNMIQINQRCCDN